jgi:DNA-binding LytR/AlgR family response regulator
MKIAVFENEYQSVSGAFSAASLLNFDNTLNIEVFPSSQSATLTEIVRYDVIFIDIDLSSKSDLDGYSLIQQLQNLDDNINKKIVILTGNNKIIESLNLRKINSINISIIIKPTDYEEITKVIIKVKKINA